MCASNKPAADARSDLVHTLRCLRDAKLCASSSAGAASLPATENNCSDYKKSDSTRFRCFEETEAYPVQRTASAEKGGFPLLEVSKVDDTVRDEVAVAPQRDALAKM